MASPLSYLSRAALAQAQAGPAAGRTGTAAAVPPVWAWGPAGPPAATALPGAGQQEAAEAEAEPPLPGTDEKVSFAPTSSGCSASATGSR
jgi:hypothetical protein